MNSSWSYSPENRRFFVAVWPRIWWVALKNNRAPLLSTWWRHQMDTFSALLAVCARNSPVPGEFPEQRPVTPNLDVFFDLRLNKGLSKQSWGWWFETLSRPLWRHGNEHQDLCIISSSYVNSNWSYGPESVKWGFDLCDLDLWPLTLTLCMELTLVIGDNS